MDRFEIHPERFMRRVHTPIIKYGSGLQANFRHSNPFCEAKEPIEFRSTSVFGTDRRKDF